MVYNERLRGRGGNWACNLLARARFFGAGVWLLLFFYLFIGKTSMKKISVVGARSHNLKNISVDIPRDKMTVVTGVSGSGKSSLAFDTIFAEGQRRYVESLSAYARQFLQVMSKPDVDSIDGLSPTISIDQKSASHNPRSTVGTVTEIHDYMRLLYARVGEPHCPKHGIKLETQTTGRIVDFLLANLHGKKIGGARAKNYRPPRRASGSV